MYVSAENELSEDGVHLDPRWFSTTSKSEESGNYEAIVVVLYCQVHLIQPQLREALIK